jgi:hypothetical protein
MRFSNRAEVRIKYILKQIEEYEKNLTSISNDHAYERCEKKI